MYVILSRYRGKCFIWQSKISTIFLFKVSLEKESGSRIRVHLHKRLEITGIPPPLVSKQQLCCLGAGFHPASNWHARQGGQGLWPRPWPWKWGGQGGQGVVLMWSLNQPVTNDDSHFRSPSQGLCSRELQGAVTVDSVHGTNGPPWRRTWKNLREMLPKFP